MATVRTPQSGQRVLRFVREPFRADTWRRVAYALLAPPVGLVCVPLSLVGAPTGRWQRALAHRFLGLPGPAGSRASLKGLAHALLATPLNLLVLVVTGCGWLVLPTNLGWPLRAGSDYANSWGGPTFAGAWAFHALVGGVGFLLIMPWAGRAMATVQLRLAAALLCWSDADEPRLGSMNSLRAVPGRLRAVRGRLRAALGFPFGRRALAALLYALIAFPLALIGFVLTLVGLLVGGALSVTTLGLWLIAVTVRGALALGRLQRGLARGLLGMDIEEPGHRPGAGALGWRRSLLADRSGWRAVACALATPFTAVLGYVAVVIGYVWGVLLTLHPVLEHWDYETRRAADGTERRVSLEFFGFQVDTWPRWIVPVALGLLLLASAAWLLRQALAPHRSWIATLLGPDPADRRIRTLEETRAQAVDDAAATLRRIERDLHDGTQARLVGLAMHLTMIRELIGAGAPTDRLLAVVDTAQGNARQAIADLRHLVKGIHPPVLDQGLDTALATLAADSALSVEVRAVIETRPIPALESIAYFCAAELLANAAKHSGATRVSVTVTARDGFLRLSVRDDGRGGAVIGAGSGLTGLLARVRTVDGTLACDSPPGGPTVVTVELPC